MSNAFDPVKHEENRRRLLAERDARFERAEAWTVPLADSSPRERDESVIHQTILDSYNEAPLLDALELRERIGELFNLIC
jgi:hypothetical protein